MSNKEMLNTFKQIICMMELHGENSFRINAYQQVLSSLNSLSTSLSKKSIDEIKSLGFSKHMAEKMYALMHSDTSSELQELLQKTPLGILDMLKINGIGPKKIRRIWKTLHITTLDKLYAACKKGHIAKQKGFGERIQDRIISQIHFIQNNAKKMLLPEAENLSLELKEILEKQQEITRVSISGDLRRNMETIEKIQFIISTLNSEKTHNFLNKIDKLAYDKQIPEPGIWRGKYIEENIPLEILFVKESHFYTQLFLHSAHPNHLVQAIDNKGQTLKKLAIEKDYSSEEEIYRKARMAYIVPEMREGKNELIKAKENSHPQIISEKDLKGVLHTHTTYSDGENSLEEMALHCKSLKYEYLGICDHSQSAYYAGGLTIDKIIRQHTEIDRLNKHLTPFKIFKGIESDILPNGNLDYTNNILAKFDFIIASIHSSLTMDKITATQRLIRAIENPYTTIIGHLTGRILLKREGYPINHKKVIDACAKNNVVIELNANPKRLDIDWRWIDYALEKNALISINPDAHEKTHYRFMRYGVMMGRKAGLTKRNTLNTLSQTEISKFFHDKKPTI